MSEVKAVGQSSGAEIAIIGMACRFPGAGNVDAFWANLRDGVDSTVHFTDQELLESGIDPTVLAARNYVKAKPVLSDIELFDAAFFGFNPREAELIDPQHRLLLENVWEALESAGYDSETYPGAISVYAGTSASSYFLNNILNNREVLESGAAFQVLLNNLHDSLATRIAYKLNLRGASYTVQTFCSTSLVAVHLACQALLNYECDTAVAGGVSISVPQKTGYYFEEGGIVSPDGHCRAFDAKANGTVFGCGVGSVVLKRLEDALAEGDPIHAVILGTATNNDGADKVSYSAPSVTGQSRVIAEALGNADVEPEQISYVEAHGTGTSLGDPAEVLALTRAFRAGTQKKQFCRLGSVKTNVGHLDAAAGVASLIKTILSLKHQQLPPSLHFETPNPEIDFTNTPFYVNSALSEWKDNGNGLFAGVSSFGIGGTNAHVILRNAPALEPTSAPKPCELLLLSARTNAALEVATANLIDHLRQHPEQNISDVAHTLQVGRRAFNHRRAVVTTSREDAIRALSSSDPKRVVSSHQEKRDAPVVFLFSGQGSQYENMGLGLYRTEPVFRECIDRCAEILKQHLKLDLRELLFPEDEQKQSAEQLKQTQFAQPALFSVEYALAKLWLSWGIKPKAMIGHSIGEYVAASLAEVFSLEDGLTLVAERGRLMQSAPAGSMLAVPMSRTQVESLLQENGFGQLSVAAINAPTMTVLSGPTKAVEEFERSLSEKGLGGSRLHTSHAFHSQMMDPIIESFRAYVSKIKLNAPKLPYLSNLTGKWINDAEAMDVNYWSRHLRQAVRFSDGLNELLERGDWIFLEVGPGQSLTNLATQHLAKPNRSVACSSLPHAKDRESDVSYLLRTLGRMWTAGAKVDWTAFHAGQRRRRVTLPTYPFERQRHWISPPKQTWENSLHRSTSNARFALDDWTYVPSWKRVPLAKNRKRDPLGNQKYCWLLFLDRGPVCVELVSRLQELGQDVITVSAGQQFKHLGTDAYEIDPGNAEHCLDLLRELRERNKVPERVVQLWNFLSPELEQNSLNRPFFSLVHLAQAIGELTLTGPIRLWVITSNLWEVNHGECVHPQKATVLGACKVIPQEYPNLTCRVIDAPPETSPRELVKGLINEFGEESTECTAYRGGQRWIQAFERVRLQASAEIPERLRQSGTYLITGGLGGIGLALAEHLAHTTKARLILVGRSDFPARDEWNEWLSRHDAADRVSRKIRKIRELESVGSQVAIFSADVSDEQQMRTVVSTSIRLFGEINGVIHAAGVAGGGIIQYKTRERAEAVMSPKIQGALVLEELLKGQPLDFFVVCSSMASIAGGFGQVDYCAANAFLDAFAQRRNQAASYTVAINWDIWQEVGMAVETEVPADLRAQREIEIKNGISTREGLEIFDRILDTDLPQVAVVTKDVWAMMERVERAELAGEDDVVHDTVTLHARPELANDYVAPRNEVEQTIANIWESLLGLTRVGVYDNFFDLGGHSLLGMQLISRLQQSFGVETPLKSLFESQTVAGLAEVITRAQKDKEESDELEIFKMIEGLADDEVDLELNRVSSEKS
jgi:acyl transferase domain-containing protein/acyl carrier protein